MIKTESKVEQAQKTLLENGIPIVAKACNTMAGDSPVYYVILHPTYE